jgi:hypothetical protein
VISHHPHTMTIRLSGFCRTSRTLPPLLCGLDLDDRPGNDPGKLLLWSSELYNRNRHDDQISTVGDRSRSGGGYSRSRAVLLPKLLSGVQLLLILGTTRRTVTQPTATPTLLTMDHLITMDHLTLTRLPRTDRPQRILTPMSRRAPIRTAPGRGPAGT